MSEQPNLIDVPKTHPTRAEKLQAFKAEHRIWTINATHLARADKPWTAVQIAAGIAENSPEAWDYVLHHEDLPNGETEEDAIFELCKENGIHFTL
jgi:hypothetical protein